MTISTKTLPLAVLLCAVLWGSAFPGIKAIYASWEHNSISPSFSNNVLIAGLRFSLAGSLLLLFAKRPIETIKNTPKRKLIGFSLFQTYLQYLCFYSALYISSGILGGLLTSTGSLWWIVLAPLLLKTPWPNKKQWILFFIGALGITIAVYHPGSGGKSIALGTLLFLCSTLSGALAIITYQSLPSIKTNSSQKVGGRAKSVTGFSLLTGGLLLTLTGINSWSLLPQLLTPTTIVLSIYLALVSAICFALWNYLSEHFPVNLLAGYRFLIPLCAVIEASLMIKGESPGWGIFIGGICVILSIIGLQKTQRNPVKN